MRMRKKMMLLWTLICLMVCVVTGCGNTGETTDVIPAQEESEKEIVEESAQTENVEETEKPKSKRGQKVTVDIKDYGFATFELASEDLVDGVWNSVITNTENGSNVSPQLSWEPVEGAESYVVYMVDTMAGNWMHWLSNNVTETSLPQGWAPEGEYIGPYPPKGGSHTYEIYVVALKQPVEQVTGTLDATQPSFMRGVISLNVLPDGSEGNILAYGHLVGTYTHGE